MIFLPEVGKIYHTRACQERLVLEIGAHSKFGVLLAKIPRSKNRWITFKQAQHWHEPNEKCLRECANETCHEYFHALDEQLQQLYCSDLCAKQQRYRRKRRAIRERNAHQ